MYSFMNRHLLFFAILLLLFTTAVYGQTSENTRVYRSSHISMNVPTHVEAYDISAVEVAPAFPGGDSEMLNYINRVRCYPASAYAGGIEGRVLCGFIVNTDGTISHVSVVRGIDADLDREAVRVIASMPRWKPGVRGGEKVSVYCYLSIPFRR